MKKSNNNGLKTLIALLLVVGAVFFAYRVPEASAAPVAELSLEVIPETEPVVIPEEPTEEPTEPVRPQPVRPQPQPDYTPDYEPQPEPTQPEPPVEEPEETVPETTPEETIPEEEEHYHVVMASITVCSITSPHSMHST